MKSITCSFLYVALLLLGVSSSATAVTIAVDDFESYTVGSTVAGNNGGSGFGGAWASNNASVSANTTVVSAALSYANGLVSSNGGSQAAQYVANTGSIVDGHLTRAIPFGGAGSDPIYMSYLWQNSVNGSPSNDDFAQLGFDGSPDNPHNSIMQRNGVFQARSSTNSSASNGAVPVNVGQTYLLVMKVEETGSGFYDQVTLWVDPFSDVELAQTIDGLSTGAGALTTANIASIALRTAFWENDDAFLIDNIRIGDSFASVVSVVPEPATASLAIMGVAFLSRRRRRAA